MTEAATSRTPIRILHLEDNEHDHVLVRETLTDSGLLCEFSLARSRQEFEVAIRSGQYHLIISDYTLPSYDGLRALSLAREWQSAAPFIFFSGTIGEEIAVESLKTGATDYVVKQRPQRLVAAVRRALQEVEERERLKLTEAALTQSEERFRTVARATNDVIWEWNLQSNRIWRSENFESVFGHRVEAGVPLANAWTPFLHPDDQERILASVSSLLASGGRIWWGEYRFRRADGSYASVLDRAFVSYDQAGKPARMVGVTIDMTERKHAEEKIREQAALLDKACDAILVCDLDDRVIFWNRSAERIYGWSATEAAGRRIHELLFDQLPLSFNEARKGVTELGEWTGEFHQITKSGRPVLVQSSWTLVRDEEGRPKSKLIINTDITGQKQLEAKFLRAQRLEILGVLVGGIAHDLNNALAPIMMGIGYLRSLPMPEETEGILSTMHSSAQRGAEMVKQVLTFARGGEGRKSAIHVAQLAREMSKIISDTFPKSIECRVVAEHDAWLVSGVPTQLHQVILNLCVNARDAMPRGGTLTLSTKNVLLDEKQAAQQQGAKPGRYLCLNVKDTGVGISADKLPQIFQPFFTTKPPGQGTGLGLSTSLGIVENHGGFMTVQSTAGQGTEFKVYLPAPGIAGVSETESTAPPLPAGKGECVLIVDDEEAILALAKTSLENYGYRALAAASGPEAVAIFARESGTIQLVIMDKSMPFMDGMATLAALRKINQDVKIVLASGHDRNKGTDTDRQINADAFIQKPFTVEKLLTTVHDVLARKT
jgi:hypothetical protein